MDTNYVAVAPVGEQRCGGTGAGTGITVDNLMKILLDGEERASALFSECVKRMTYEWASEVGKSPVTSDFKLR